MPRHFKREEDQILAQVIGLLRMHGVRCFHCPNEFDGTVQAASRRQAQGVTAGVPDIIIIESPPALTHEIAHYHGVPFVVFVGAALELKREKGRNAEPEQLEWLEQFARARFVTAVTKGLRASLEQLVAWGYLPASVLDLPGCQAEPPRPSRAPSPSRVRGIRSPPSTRGRSRLR